MQGLKAARLIAAVAMFAAIASAPALADKDSAMPEAATQAKHQTVDAKTPTVRWAAIAAQGERFQNQRQHKAASETAKAKPRAFMAMAMAARESR